MKLTCVLIIAVLFLTAYQLATAASHAKGKQKHRALRPADKHFRFTKRCNNRGGGCSQHPHCCSGTCNKTFGVCL
uniref:Conotoxin VxVIA n=2 Tax=Conus TaxID=6490 RepID=O16A_CONVX|nr:RecName: Full=Conotoxin VxVIA; AltName: Full=Conotoxin vx6a; Flags: Precursor [Conus vexillum]AAO21703.1 conotoxin Vx-VIa precursor [Conus vexillum]AAZ83752.1 MgJ42P [Conus magus]